MRFRSFLIVFLLVTTALAAGTSAMYILSQADAGLSDRPQTGEPEKLKERLISYFGGVRKKMEDPAPLNGVGDPPPQGDSHLTGLPRRESGPELFFGVMIDMAAAARPHFRGLEHAGLLLEMPAEGGVPRIMAVFAVPVAPAEIGPVRSARHYFIQIAETFLDGYVHAGGSPQAYAELASTQMADFDESLKTMHRDPKIGAPHNLFLDTPEILPEISGPKLDRPLFPFSETPPENGSSATEIAVDFSTTRHLVRWEYDDENGCYRRNQQFETAEICVENVAVLVTAVWPIPNDPKNRLNMNTTGSGTLIVFRDGIATEGSWSREPERFFRFSGSLGEEIPFKPGVSAIQVVDSREKVRFSAAE